MRLLPIFTERLPRRVVAFALILTGCLAVNYLVFTGTAVFGIFTTFQRVLYGIATALVVVSYYAIPYSLARLRVDGKKELIAEIATSPVFTGFVRSCGTDHWIMFGGMTIHAYGWMHHMHVGIAWLMIISIWIVAIMSVLSAFIIWVTATREAR